ncbi:hypothetical protein [Pseudomonas fluorescens]|uniref:Uncharacterized protein n=1 Tax=Pseudomonas fluorescens TaxID=294 RepID=A0A5E7IS03_PSEFL|nr:hypothetical protein [Pseudomonas fluorescens]VVO78504.1 hypothetical protein PS880_01674 [Pseudomonas fluorescens]
MGNDKVELSEGEAETDGSEGLPVHPADQSSESMNESLGEQAPSLIWDFRYLNNLDVVNPSFKLGFRIPKDEGNSSSSVTLRVVKGSQEIAKEVIVAGYGIWYEVTLNATATGAARLFCSRYWFGEDLIEAIFDLWISPQPAFDNQSFTKIVTGINGDGSRMQIFRGSGDGAEFSPNFSSSGNRWAVELRPLVKSGAQYMTIKQVFMGYTGRSVVDYVTYFTPPIITKPEATVIINQEGKVEIAGTNAAPGYVIHIMNEGGTIDYGLSEPALNDGSWSKWIALHPGDYRITARHRESENTGWSEVKSFTAMTSLSITTPAPGETVDPRGLISGSGAFGGATVEVLKDLEHSFKIGEGIAGLQGQWTVTRFDTGMPPGPFSIVARQIVNGGAYVSAERSFKVRPPALNGVNVTSPNETVLKFSGTGHPGATVEITVVSGPGETNPPMVVVGSNNAWETTVTNWPFGTYSLRAIQKVSDNANGWIESLPYTFPVNRVLPDPSDVTYTKDYQPTFSGKGYTGATVKLYNPGGGSFAAPDARVSNSQWSSRASEVWGPVLNREVHIKQFLDGQQSPNWVILKVTIPPLAPVIGQVQEDGLSPKISGTCWSGAVVEITFSDAPTIKHPATVTGTNWTFQRGTGFEPDVVTHTVTVTQTAASQTSPAVSETFKVYTPLSKPVIIKPEPDAEVGRDMTVEGQDGMAGATMQLRDAQFGHDLGTPKLLTSDGEWSIDLTGLEFRQYTIDARQTRYERPSERSDMLKFEVVLMPPVITQPMESGDLPRTATFAGWATSGARVEVWLDGAADPLLRDIPVGTDGRWKAEVTLPVGAKIIRARQTFEGRTSRDSRPLNYNVVPAAPYIETPVMDEHLGRQVVVSGFGVPGDTVTVKLGVKVLGRSQVLEDRTWSVTVVFDQPDGRYSLLAMASCEGVESADSAERTFVLGTYLPTIDAPQAGRWVSDPVCFKGQGKPGIGQVTSWFNSGLKWSPDVPVNTSGWQGSAVQPLPYGGNWFRFRQTLTDGEGGATVSDWLDSERFEVWSAPPTKT